MSNRPYNYNIALMKCGLSYLVVLCHYWNPSKESRLFTTLGTLRSVAVPIFFIISFFLTAKIYEEIEHKKLGQRLHRLALPYFIWGGLYYAFNSLFYRAFDIPIPFTVKDLWYQISLGSDRFLCPQMWSQFDMMIITGIMWLVCRFFWPRRRAVLIGIAIAAIVFQYTGANMELFGGLEYELRYPLGRIAEMLPFAVIGYLLSSEVCIAHIRKYGVLFITASFVVSLIILLQSTIVVAKGFGYGGLGLVVLSCACFIICYCVPIPRRMPQALKDMIEFLSRYSFGVYCVHFGVGYYLNLYLRLRGLGQNTMTGCVFIYAVSIIVSWAIAKFPIRQCAGLVT